MLLRRSLILALGSMPLLIGSALSQTAVKAHRVGLLSSGAPLTDNSELVAGVTAGFSKRGYIVGSSLIFERRAAEAQPSRLPQLVDDLKSKTELIGYPVLPVVQQLVAACSDHLGEYSHWGATTQDITDTATIMQIRQALSLVMDRATLSDTLSKGLAVFSPYFAFGAIFDKAPSLKDMGPNYQFDVKKAKDLLSAGEEPREE